MPRYLITEFNYFAELTQFKYIEFNAELLLICCTLLSLTTSVLNFNILFLVHCHTVTLLIHVFNQPPYH